MLIPHARTLRRVAVVIGMVGLLGCGDGYGDNPSGPSGGGGSGSGGSGQSGATITIGGNGAVSPASVTISVGQSVTFVNNHSAVHEMHSDPHPVHTDCPPLNAVGVMNPNQTKASNAFTTARTCGFHDHRDPNNDGLRGTITIR